MLRPLVCLAILAISGAGSSPVKPRPPRLQLVVFTSDSAEGYVTSVAILGPTEAVVVDAQYFRSNARREADSLGKLGRRVKAILITHPHEDHYFGAAAIVERYPGIPVYMTPSAIDLFRRTSQRFLADLRKREPSELPDSFVTPTPLPSGGLTVDGDSVEIVPDQQGDVYRSTNSFLWIPSLRAVIAGDIVFNHVHAWLGSSDSTTRLRWHASISHIAAFDPAIVVAGHKMPTASDNPDQLAEMDTYLRNFDAALGSLTSAASVVARMRALHPDYGGLDLLQGSAAALRPKP